MFVRSATGLLVRRHDTLALLPDGGEDVPDLDWCHRRLRDGDVLEGPAAAAPATAEPGEPHEPDAPPL